MAPKCVFFEKFNNRNIGREKSIQKVDFLIKSINNPHP